MKWSMSRNIDFVLISSLLGRGSPRPGRSQMPVADHYESPRLDGEGQGWGDGRRRALRRASPPPGLPHQGGGEIWGEDDESFRDPVERRCTGGGRACAQD